MRVAIQVFLLVVAATAHAESRDPLLAHFEGDWGLPGTEEKCEDVESTFTFSSDGSRLELRYARPVEDLTGHYRDVYEYSVIAIAGNSVRMKLEGETRTDDRGELVVWDLVRISDDSYCWHRADWTPGQCTVPRLRCGSASDRFERETTQEAGNVLSLFDQGRYVAASAHFELPKAIPESERAAEFQRLSNSLRIIVDELGAPSRWSLVQQDDRYVPEIVNIALGPSHVLVSQEHGNYFYAFYKVEYLREGVGYFRAAFYPGGGIAQMTFSLPRVKSERMAEIGERVLRETAHEF